VAAFFLYLANQLTVIIGKGQFILEPEGFGILSSIMPFMVVLAFLVLGFFATLSIGSMGATQIMSGAKRGGKWAGRQAAKIGRGTPQVQKFEERIRKRAERLPAIGAVFGGPGAYEASLKREKGELGKRLEVLATPELHNIVAKRALTRTEQLRRSAALEILANRGKLEEADRKYIETAVRVYGADDSEILKRMPHWAAELKKPGEFDEVVIRNQVEKINPWEFRQKAQTEALENIDVFSSMDSRKVKEIERKGSDKQREAIAQWFATSEKITKLLKKHGEIEISDKKAANRMREVINYVNKSPVYREYI